MNNLRPSSKQSSLTAGLSQAQSLVRQRRLAEARQLLSALDHRHPNHSDVLLAQAQLYEQMQDWSALIVIGERLVRAHPRDAGLLFALGKGYLQAQYLALALRTFRRFLTEHPEHKSAADAHQEVSRLSEFFAQEIKVTGLPAEDAMGTLELTDEVRSLGAQRRFVEARKIAEMVTSRYPRFLFALNSLAHLHLAEGNLEQALAVIDQAIEVEPENLHVRARQIRMLCLLGRMEEARHQAGKLAALPTARADEEMSRAEAFSYLGDDQAVAQAFQRATDELPQLAKAGIFYHLAAVAHLRLGHEAEAMELWKEALKRMPALEVARQNVADRCKLTGEQHAPWPFSLAMWVPARTLEDLNRAMQGRKSDEELRHGAQSFLAQHPEMVALLPVLLDRGDPEARKLALSLARSAGTLELLPALREFAQGRRGPDLMRNQAAHAAMEAGLLPARPLRLWLSGAWRELLPCHYSWDAEPDSPLSSNAARVLSESTKELAEGNPLQAERLLRKGVEAEPNSPSLLHNLAAALSAQRRNREADALLDEIHERFPGFVAATTDIARRYLRRGQVDEAEMLLMPLLARKRFYAGEFACLCMAQIEALLARKNEAPLSVWLQMWEQADPDHPALGPFRKRIEQSSLFHTGSTER